MPSQHNINTVQGLQENLTRAKALAIADYRGLSMLQMKELRQEVTKLNAELKVTKNRLLKVALRNAKYSGGDELSSSLTGPSIILFCYQDEAGPIKAVYDFSLKNELPKLKVGFLGQEFLSTDRLVNLAKLPGKLELQAKLVGTLNGPIYGLVNVLQGNIRKLVYVLKSIQEKTN